MKITISSLVLVCLLIGCAPNLKREISLPLISLDSKGSDDSARGGRGFVSVDEVKDLRTGQEIAHYGSMNATTSESVPGAVRLAVEDALTKRGFGISDSAPLMLVPSVKKWIVNVSGGMPTRVEGEAELYIELFDPASRRVYSGTYQGAAEIQNSSVDDRDVRDALGTAMKEALSQLVSDQQLQKLLSAF